MPRYGFNFLWMYLSGSGRAPEEPDTRALDFMADFGFNFVRVPTDYRTWTKDFDYLHPDEAVFAYFDRYLEACRTRGFQMSLNLHRAIVSMTTIWSATTFEPTPWRSRRLCFCGRPSPGAFRACRAGLSALTCSTSRRRWASTA